MPHYCLDKTNQDWRYDIDYNKTALVNWSSRQIRQFSLWYGFVEDMFLFSFYLFLYKFILSSAGNNEPIQGWCPTFVDNKGLPWGPTLCQERQWWFLFTYIVLYKYRATYIFLKSTELSLKQYTLLILLSLVQARRYEKLLLRGNALSNLLFSYL